MSPLVQIGKRPGADAFLPTNLAEARARGWQGLDVVLVNGDAYVDHPTFGVPLLARVLAARGNMDSMVNHYTAAKKRRSSDAYTPDAAPGRRPDYATAVYARRLEKLFPEVPVVIGGVEASLRRLAHYDYWSDRVRRSILADCPADLLVYGMGE